jgi:hypothetical protein
MRTKRVNDEEIKLRFDYVQRDLGKLETAVNLLTANVQKIKPQRNWPNMITILLVVIPLYALVADLILKGST